jgi:hypothetical protein
MPGVRVWIEAKANCGLGRSHFLPIAHAIWKFLTLVATAHVLLTTEPHILIQKNRRW